MYRHKNWTWSVSVAWVSNVGGGNIPKQERVALKALVLQTGEVAGMAWVLILPTPQQRQNHNTEYSVSAWNNLERLLTSVSCSTIPRRKDVIVWEANGMHAIVVITQFKESGILQPYQHWRD